MPLSFIFLTCLGLKFQLLIHSDEMKETIVLLLGATVSVTYFCHGVPVHVIANAPFQKFIRNKRSAPHRDLLAYLDISRLEREEQEKSGIWKSVQDVESYRDVTEESILLAEEDLSGCHDFNQEDEHCSKTKKGGGKEEEEETEKKEKAKTEKEGNENIKEHPLRTDEWLLHVTMSPFLLPGNRERELFPDLSMIHLRTEKNKKQHKRQIIRFAKNGYVMIMEDPNDCTENDKVMNQESKHGMSPLTNPVIRRFVGKRLLGLGRDVDEWNCNNGGKDLDEHGMGRNNKCHNYASNRITKIGKWKMDTSGVSWSIPVTYKVKMASNGSSLKSCTIARTTLHYHADIHLSKFQSHPRMFRGVVTRDHFYGFGIPGMDIRKDLFRPVIATFTAEGIGTDTVDTSYKKRGFGLKGNA